MRHEGIDKLIKNINLNASPDLDNKIHAQIDKARPNIKPTFAKNKIMRFAAMIAIAFLAFYSGIAYKNRAHQEQLAEVATELNLRSTAELMSYISLSRAFRQGNGTEALDKQLEIADKKTIKTKTRLTIDQLLCESDDCDEL